MMAQSEWEKGGKGEKREGGENPDSPLTRNRTRLLHEFRRLSGDFSVELQPPTTWNQLNIILSSIFIQKLTRMDLEFVS